MSDETIQVHIGTIPGELKKYFIQVDSSVDDLISLADLSCFKQSHQISINGHICSLEQKIKQSCIVTMTSNVFGKGFEYHPSDIFFVYYDGRRGVKKRRSELETFLDKLNAGREKVICVEEHDYKNRSAFLEKSELIDGDVTLVVYDEKDLEHDALYPYIIKHMTFVVSTFQGVPLGSKTNDAYHHHMETVLRLQEKHARNFGKKSLSHNNLANQSAAHQTDIEIWNKITTIMNNPSKTDGRWLYTNDQISFELTEHHGISISAKRISQRIQRLNNSTDTPHNGYSQQLKRMKAINRKKGKNIIT